MDFVVNNQTTLREIRETFKTAFPYLDIAFFSERHAPGEASSLHDRLAYDIEVSEAGDPHRIGELRLYGKMTAAKVEKEFEAQFGLHAQVLRKSGNSWLQTTALDNLSLDELNRMAQTVAESKPEKEEPEDYHEQE